MYRITPPNINVQDVLNIILQHLNTHARYGKRQSPPHLSTLVIEAYQNHNLSQYLTEYERHYNVHSSALYDIAGTEERLDTVLGISVKDMEKLYNDFYTKSKTDFLGYGLRKRLRDLTKNACPICETPWGELVDELDHVLPKAIFPQYAITPINLVCICKDCNNTKLDTIGDTDSSGIINPYFNFINLAKYVKCEVKVNSNDTDFDILVKLKDNNELPDLRPNQHSRIKFFYNDCYKLNERKGIAVRTRILPNLIENLLNHRNLSIQVVRGYFSDLKDGIDVRELQNRGQLSDEFLRYILADELSTMTYDVYKVFYYLVEQRRNENSEIPEEIF